MNAGDSDVTPFEVLVYKKYQISKEYDQRVFLGSFVFKKTRHCAAAGECRSITM